MSNQAKLLHSLMSAESGFEKIFDTLTIEYPEEVNFFTLNIDQKFPGSDRLTKDEKRGIVVGFIEGALEVGLIPFDGNLELIGNLSNAVLGILERQMSDNVSVPQYGNNSSAFFQGMTALLLCIEHNPTLPKIE